ncbi:Bro-N domain-containing protein [Lentisphaerota bacterium WC36G]|nr:Bro-N domain-containing protein [Lentisphaerae bacterium WC36]
MENKLHNFNNQNVRTVFKDNQIWFVAKDVCDILKLSNPTKALRSLDDDERSNFKLGRQGLTNVVNESGLYHLIFKSRKPVAKEFRKWVTSEVLPSIRKYGFYLSTKDEMEIRNFIQHFFPDAKYGEMSDKTNYRRLIAVRPHFRSCKHAKINLNQPTLFNQKEESNENV